jgi:hypothetical protein
MQGKYRKAVDQLWQVEALARTDIMEARGLLETAQGLRAELTGSKRRECEELITSAEAIIERLTGSPGGAPLAYLPDCQVLSSSGLPPVDGEKWDLTFKDTELRLGRRGATEIRIPYSDLNALEIGGAGMPRTASFVASSLVRPRAREGELIDTALDAIQDPHDDDVVIGLQTAGEELLLLTRQPVPDALLQSASRFNLRGQAQASYSIFISVAAAGLGLALAATTRSVWIGLGVFGFLVLRFGGWTVILLLLMRAGIVPSRRR